MRTLIALALALAVLACSTPHGPQVHIAPDGTPYVDDCPPGLEDVACFEAVAGA